MRAQHLRLGERQPIRRLPGVVEPELLERRQVLDHVARLPLVALGHRPLEPGEHRPQRRDPGRVRGDVLPDGRRGDLPVVDLALHGRAAQVRHAHELEPPLERRELGRLLERRELLLVRARDEHDVELQDELVERHPGRLARAEQVLERVRVALEQVRVLDDPAVRGDERPVRLEHHEGVERGRERRARPVRGHLPVPRVGEVLRLDRDRRLLVPGGDVEPLDLDVAQHLQPVAVVRGEQRVVDLAAAVAQLAVHEVLRQDEVAVAGALAGGGPAPLLEQPSPLLARDEQQRMVLHRAREPRIERVALEVRVGRELSGLGARPEPEPAAALQPPLAREHPVEPVEGALGLRRVRLHAPDERGDDRRLRRPVRSVQEDELGDAARPHEGAERAVQRGLHLLLAGDAERPRLRLEGQIEELPAADLPDRRLPLLRAEVVEDVAEVLRRAPRVPPRRLGERLQVLLEREDRAVLVERALHAVSHARQPAACIHPGDLQVFS